MGARASEPMGDVSVMKDASETLEHASSTSVSVSSESQGRVSLRSEEAEVDVELKRLGSSCDDLTSAKYSSTYEHDAPTLTISLVVEGKSDVQVVVSQNLTDDEMTQLLRRSVLCSSPEGECDLLLIDAQSDHTVPVSAASVREGGRYKPWFHDAGAIEGELHAAAAELETRTEAVEALTAERAEVLHALAALRQECEAEA